MQQNIKIGFIGAGNMGSAVIFRLAGQNAENINVYDIDTNKIKNLQKSINIKPVASVADIIKTSEIIFIAVKPDNTQDVLDQIKGCQISFDEKIFVSIAAGIKISTIEKSLGNNARVIRVMPNTPALHGEGMSVLSPNSNISDETLESVKEIFSLTGQITVLPEKLMDAATGVSGSGPAYVFTFIQALTDGGVKMGLPRKEAQLLAAQTVMGAAKMVLEGKEPIELRGKVTSPGGTTIDAVHVLEKSGFSGIVMDAVQAAALKSKALGEGK